MAQPLELIWCLIDIGQALRQVFPMKILRLSYFACFLLFFLSTAKPALAQTSYDIEVLFMVLTPNRSSTLS
jgi:hypothetical protein